MSQKIHLEHTNIDDLYLVCVMYNQYPLSLSLSPLSLSLLPSLYRSVTSADQTSLDRSERASLDSKASTDVSLASGGNAPGEVAIGNLIDITGKLRYQCM